MKFFQFLAPSTIPLHGQFTGSVLALVGPVVLFILLVINNLPAPTTQALSELPQLSVPGRRTEHGQGMRKA